MQLLRSYLNTIRSDEKDVPIYISWAGHEICSPKDSVGPRVLDNYMLAIVVRGKGYFSHDGTDVPIGEEDIFWLFPGVKHYFYADASDPWEILWVSFNGNMCEKFTSILHISPCNPFMLGALTEGITICMNEIVSSLGDKCGHKLRAIGNIYILFDMLQKMTCDYDKILEEHLPEDIVIKAKKYIGINYHKYIDVDIICNYVRYSRSYFSRIFKKEVGMSMPEYVNQVRINRAKFLIKNTKLNISEISKSVGYEDPFYFSRKFKEQVGESPTKYLDTYLKKHAH